MVWEGRMITNETRKKFRHWSAALDKLTKKEREDEIIAWMKAALMILDEDGNSNGKVKKEKMDICFASGGI